MEEQEKPNLFGYLDKLMGDDGLKTSNKINISIDRETAITIVGIGAGLILFSHAIGTIRRLIIKK